LLRSRESELASVKAKSKTEVAALEARLNEKQAELEKINNTLGWRLLSRYGKFKYRFLLPAYRLFRSGSSDSKR
jgi:hypothetical protein